MFVITAVIKKNNVLEIAEKAALILVPTDLSATEKVMRKKTFMSAD